ncbi:MAG TPA: carbohydrate kinase family protein [Gemmatimonadales bacterium]|nr:carbohydrate kinase family protein [Gemmatimonadales bacterium]
MRKVGVIGSLVWDEIHGRDPRAAPVEEWGGIAYALAGMDAALPDGWEIVPLVKVGWDLSAESQGFLRTLARLSPGARCVEVPTPNNRVVLHYQNAERRCERMSGGVPAWTWPELGPLVADLDALYINFISGFELGLGTAQALRQAFRGSIYADLHSLFLGMRQDGIRMLQPLPDASSWFGCFDVIQLNEDEMRQLSDEPLAVSAHVLGAGAQALVVTLGPRGAVYVTGGRADGQTDRLFDAVSARQPVRPSARPAVTELIQAPIVEVLDPTGCGDVFGATCCARLLGGDSLPDAVAGANRAAARAATFRGAGGLAAHLRGELLGV